MNTYLKMIFLFITMISVIPPVYSQNTNETKSVKIPKILFPKLNMDGNADEAFWNGAGKVEDFENNSKGEPVNEKTDLYLFYDDEALYLAFQCMDQDIQSTYKNRDTDLWNEEVFEFFIYPHAEIPNPIEYFELQWNPLGTVFDAVLTNHLDENGKSKSYKANRDWTSTGMDFTVRVNGSLNVNSDIDKDWSGEIKLPFQTLGQSTPKPGDTWRANFYRYSRNTGEELIFIAWNATHSTFHEPNWFGQLLFE